jgi:hypothetical protein
MQLSLVFTAEIDRVCCAVRFFCKLLNEDERNVRNITISPPV